MGFYPVRRGWATGQAAIAAAMGRASRLASFGPPYPHLLHRCGVGRSGTAPPRTRSEDGISHIGMISKLRGQGFAEGNGFHFQSKINVIQLVVTPR